MSGVVGQFVDDVLSQLPAYFGQFVEGIAAQVCGGIDMVEIFEVVVFLHVGVEVLGMGRVGVVCRCCRLVWPCADIGHEGKITIKKEKPLADNLKKRPRPSPNKADHSKKRLPPPFNSLIIRKLALSKTLPNVI